MTLNDCSPGSHPHADRANWRPAETFEEYIANVNEGLEDFSQRRAAKLLGVPRVKLWRWCLLAELPEELFERLIGMDSPASTREMANVAIALQGRGKSAEAERCPHCGEILRVRGRWRRETANVVNDWLRAGRTRSP